MKAGSEKHAGVVRKAILEGGRDDFAAVLEAIRDSGSLDYARAAARREADAAIASLQPLAESEFKRSLLELASFSVTRTS
jgi:octaprenyl-diphosphate synthase